MNFLDNLDETGGNNTANNVKWYTEPPFNYDKSELISCKEEKIYDKKEKKLECYATVDDYKDLGPVLISDWLEKKTEKKFARDSCDMSSPKLRMIREPFIADLEEQCKSAIAEKAGEKKEEKHCKYYTEYYTEY